VVVFGWSGEGFGLAFDVALHVGTLLAVLWYFRRDWQALTIAAFNAARKRRVTSVEEMRALFLLIALLPAIAGGLLLEDLAESTFRNPSIMAGALILFGIVLWVVDRSAPSVRPLDSMRVRDAIVIGVAQVLALVPGVSRSGATMTAGRMLAFDRLAAARFSFLMSMPVIAAAAVHKVPTAVAEQGFSPQLLAGTAASAITGWLAIGFLLRFLTTRGFASFAIYRIVLGIIIYAITIPRG
jgi:undecaprenyl-diphosphatase